MHGNGIWAADEPKDLEKAVQSKYACRSVFADGVRILADDEGNVFQLRPFNPLRAE